MRDVSTATLCYAVVVEVLVVVGLPLKRLSEREDSQEMKPQHSFALQCVYLSDSECQLLPPNCLRVSREEGGER